MGYDEERRQKIKEAVERASGLAEGKIEIMDIKEDEGKGIWTLRYREKNKKIERLEFTDYDELQEVIFEFGGKNLETCICDDRYLSMDGSWNADDLLRVGHTPTKIRLQAKKVIDRSSIGVKIPKECGDPGTLNAQRQENAAVVNFISTYQKEATFTRSFEDYTELNNLIAFVMSDEYLSQVAEHYKVKEICTQNNTTKDLCRWKKSRAGDGTSRMVMRLIELNGKPYQTCLRQDLQTAGGDMFVEHCKQLKMEKKTEKTVCTFAAERGDVGTDGYQATG